jgi:hypothetical protein
MLTLGSFDLLIIVPARDVPTVLTLVMVDGLFDSLICTLPFSAASFAHGVLLVSFLPQNIACLSEPLAKLFL